MKHIIYTVLTIIGIMVFATALASLTGCGGSSQALNLAKQNRQDIKYEQRDREIADEQLQKAINHRHTEISNLQHELKKLRAVVEIICSKNPEQCKEQMPKELDHWR